MLCKSKGFPWAPTGVATAEWGGMPVLDILNACGARPPPHSKCYVHIGRFKASLHLWCLLQSCILQSVNLRSLYKDVCTFDMQCSVIIFTWSWCTVTNSCAPFIVALNYF